MKRKCIKSKFKLTDITKISDKELDKLSNTEIKRIIAFTKMNLKE